MIYDLVLIAAATVQATYAAPPASREVPQAMIDRVVDMAMTTPMPNGSLDAPVNVPAEMLRSTSDLLRLHHRTAEKAVRDQARSIVRPLTRSPVRGCRVVVEHPEGVTVAGSKMLHGMYSLLQCEGFVALVRRESFSLPLTLAVASGFPRSRMAAIVNGRPVSKNYRQSSAGIRQVTYRCIDSNQVTTLSLTSERLPLPLLDRSVSELMDRLM